MAVIVIELIMDILCCTTAKSLFHIQHLICLAAYLMLKGAKHNQQKISLSYLEIRDLTFEEI
jgi:hypothetical protein